MFRLMVRSHEGRELIRGPGWQWQRREVWSTWGQYEDAHEALMDRTAMRHAGVEARVIREDQYDSFCSTHLMA